MKKETKLPKWYQLRVRSKLKRDIIQEIVQDYEKPVKISSKQTFKPTDMDVKEYTQELYKLKLSQLLQIGRIEEAKPKLTTLDKVSKLKKKKALLVTIYHKNGSRTHFVCARHTRIIKIDGLTYLCPPNKGNYDNKYNMMSYSYYEGNPFPIEFNNDYKNKMVDGTTVPDGELLSSTLDFEFAQRLTQSKLKEKINLAVIFSILAFVCALANLILEINGQGLI